MKAKTVWVGVRECHKISVGERNDYSNHWIRSDGGIVFNGLCDAKWLNVYGYPISDVLILDGSKILGDE